MSNETVRDETVSGDTVVNGETVVSEEAMANSCGLKESESVHAKGDLG